MSVQHNEVIENIAKIVAAVLRKNNVANAIANNTAISIVDALSTKFKGQVFYIPVDYAYSPSAVTHDASVSRAKNIEERRCELLRFLVSISIESLKKLGYNPLVSGEIASAISTEFCFHFSGQSLFYPKDKRFKSQQRNNQILKDFNGLNHAELAEQHDLSVRSVYRILNREKNKKEKPKDINYLTY